MDYECKMCRRLRTCCKVSKKCSANGAGRSLRLQQNWRNGYTCRSELQFLYSKTQPKLVQGVPRLASRLEAIDMSGVKVMNVTMSQDTLVNSVGATWAEVRSCFSSHNLARSSGLVNSTASMDAMLVRRRQCLRLLYTSLLVSLMIDDECEDMGKTKVLWGASGRCGWILLQNWRIVD